MPPPTQVTLEYTVTPVTQSPVAVAPIVAAAPLFDPSGEDLFLLGVSLASDTTTPGLTTVKRTIVFNLLTGPPPAADFFADFPTPEDWPSPFLKLYAAAIGIFARLPVLSADPVFT